MTVTNKQAKRKIGRAIADLLQVRDDYSGLTPAEQKVNEDAIVALKQEYFALAGTASSASYAEITQALSGATSNLKEIKDKRERFMNGLVTASKLLGTMTSVLKLIA
jgi:hypothetical protein